MPSTFCRRLNMGNSRQQRNGLGIGYPHLPLRLNSWIKIRFCDYRTDGAKKRHNKGSRHVLEAFRLEWSLGNEGKVEYFVSFPFLLGIEFIRHVRGIALVQQSLIAGLGY